MSPIHRGRSGDYCNVDLVTCRLINYIVKHKLMHVAETLMLGFNYKLY